MTFPLMTGIFGPKKKKEWRFKEVGHALCKSNCTLKSKLPRQVTLQISRPNRYMPYKFSIKTADLILVNFQDWIWFSSLRTSGRILESKSKEFTGNLTPEWKSPFDHMILDWYWEQFLRAFFQSLLSSWLLKSRDEETTATNSLEIDSILHFQPVASTIYRCIRDWSSSTR